MEFGKPEDPDSEILRAEGPEPRFPKETFFGGNRMLSIWKAVIFLFLLVEVGPRITRIAILFPLGAVGYVPATIKFLLVEAANFGILLGASYLMAQMENRSLRDYGLPGKSAFRRNFWLGFLLGLAEVSVLVGLIRVFGGYTFGTLALQGRAILGWGLFHLVLFLFVGLYEEFLFRGYAQFTLGSGMGFWPAAVILSAWFGYMHLGNRGENWVGVSSVFLVGLLFAFTLWRTGSLWYAIGLHASFDWGETYLFSVPNSGVLEPGHLSNAVLHGRAWLTGGQVGPEGSVFCFLTLGLQFLVVTWLFPAKKSGGAGTGEAKN
jgi:membrane protease YdiL (CAAX protease family)